MLRSLGGIRAAKLQVRLSTPAPGPDRAHRARLQPEAAYNGDGQAARLQRILRARLSERGLRENALSVKTKPMFLKDVKVAIY